MVCLLVDVAQPPGAGDAYMLDFVARPRAPRVLLLNKIDLVRKDRLLPRIAELRRARPLRGDRAHLERATGDGADRLLDLLFARLPEGEPLYDPELLTIHPERFLVAERIREKVLERTERGGAVRERGAGRALGGGARERDLVRIYASILVEREGQKKIVVGAAGSCIKDIGTAARLDLEEYLARRVYLQLHVRVEPGWRENPRILAELEREARLGG